MDNKKPLTISGFCSWDAGEKIHRRCSTKCTCSCHSGGEPWLELTSRTLTVLTARKKK